MSEIEPATLTRIESVVLPRTVSAKASRPAWLVIVVVVIAPFSNSSSLISVSVKTASAPLNIAQLFHCPLIGASNPTSVPPTATDPAGSPNSPTLLAGKVVTPGCLFVGSALSCFTPSR